jgi:hypothetical protein
MRGLPDPDRDLGYDTGAAGMGLPARQRVHDRLEVLVVQALGVGSLDPVGKQLIRVAALAEPDLEAAAAELIEHRDLLRQPRRLVEGKHVHQRAQPDPRGSHGRRGQENARRRREPQRSAVVLGQMVDVEPLGLGVGKQVKPLPV